LVIGNGLVTWAEIYVSSGLAALICALTPLWIVLINSFSGKRENVSGLVWLGFLVCLVGQFLIFQDNLKDFANPNYTLGIICIIIANMAWAIGTVYSKNHQTNTHPLFGAGLQMISGGVVLDIIGSMRGEWHVLNPEPVAVWMLAYLIIFGSLIAYGSYIYVLKKLPAAIVSTYAFINTLVAIFIGWLWLDETVNLMVMISVMLTLGGLWLINYAHNKSNTSG
jgi:drug/metabolite transporter (DMT)-like permease